jgi:hypothetical protein
MSHHGSPAAPSRNVISIDASDDDHELAQRLAKRARVALCALLSPPRTDPSHKRPPDTSNGTEASDSTTEPKAPDSSPTTEPQTAAASGGEGDSGPREKSAQQAAVPVDATAAAVLEDSALQTSKILAIEALVGLVWAYPAWVDKPVREQLVRELLPMLLAADPDDCDPGHPTEVLELLFRASYLSALTAVVAWRPPEGDLKSETAVKLQQLSSEARRRAREQSVKLATQLVARLDDIGDDSERRAHPYVCWRVQRALRKAQENPEIAGTDAADGGQPDSVIRDAQARLWTHLNPQVDELLVRHQLGLVNPAETVALAFAASCAGLLDQHHYADAAARAALDVPDARTAWGDGRLLHRDDQGRRLAVPTFEVFNAVAETLLRSLTDRGTQLKSADDARKATKLGVVLARDTITEALADRGQAGWTAEHVLGEQQVELWSTAAALNLMIAAQQVFDAAARSRVLASYEVELTWEANWPTWLQWDSYVQNSEPDSGGQILTYIDEKIVAPRSAEPLKTRSDPAVVLLFGPPGTTKTTIARAVATGLEWPLVNLSPGNFLREGLDGVERLAGEVFADLRQLSQAVVILDEADELFRARRPQPESEAIRGVAAFMTASMLPRLQDLHDRGRIVLFICTNFLTSIDPAMRRLGRVDEIIAVPPPDEPGRLRIINQEVTQQVGGAASEIAHLDAAKRRLAEQTERFIRGEMVQAARDLLSEAKRNPFKDDVDAGKRAKTIADNRRPTIAIGDASQEQRDAWEGFLADLKALSEPHRQTQKSSWIPTW